MRSKLINEDNSKLPKTSHQLSQYVLTRVGMHKKMFQN